MTENKAFEYKLLEAGEIYAMGLLNSDEEILKNYFPCKHTFTRPEIVIKVSNGEFATLQLQKVRHEFVATDKIFGYSIIVSVAPLKNDKSKKSIYIRRKLINSPVPA
ncbi:MAG: hypothetical protein JJT78_14425 [Leptospira sp.]|nr:hypothetical protein [Leptospira sp.]